MSHTNPYSTIAKRTFESALIYLLETGYGLLGGRRILALLAEDVQQLVDEFYPSTERAQSGDLIWTCTADEGKNAEAGERTEEYKTTTVRLPLIAKEDLQARTEKKTPLNKRSASAREWGTEQGEMLPLKGYRMDRESRPTHKREIVRLSE